MSFPEFPSAVSDALAVLFCGREDCAPGHVFGPAVRSHYLLHYCLSGRGRFEAAGRVYSLCAGEGFLILPGEVTCYAADCKDPWSYLWFAFHGTMAQTYLARCGLDGKRRIFRCDDGAALLDCAEQMLLHTRIGYSEEFFTESQMYRVFGILAACAGLPYQNDVPCGSVYVNKAAEYMQSNYQRHPFSIQAVADFLSLNRSYLTALFQREFHMPPRTYLLRLRMDRACALLRTTGIPVSQVARSCGYADPLAFSKAFHKVTGASPSAYRAAHAGQSGGTAVETPHSAARFAAEPPK